MESSLLFRNSDTDPVASRHDRAGRCRLTPLGRHSSGPESPERLARGRGVGRQGLSQGDTSGWTCLQSSACNNAGCRVLLLRDAIPASKEIVLRSSTRGALDPQGNARCAEAVHYGVTSLCGRVSSLLFSTVAPPGLPVPQVPGVPNIAAVGAGCLAM